MLPEIHQSALPPGHPSCFFLILINNNKNLEQKNIYLAKLLARSSLFKHRGIIKNEKGRETQKNKMSLSLIQKKKVMSLSLVYGCFDQLLYSGKVCAYINCTKEGKNVLNHVWNWYMCFLITVKWSSSHASPKKVMYGEEKCVLFCAGDEISRKEYFSWYEKPSLLTLLTDDSFFHQQAFVFLIWINNFCGAVRRFSINLLMLKSAPSWLSLRNLVDSFTSLC